MCGFYIMTANLSPKVHWWAYSGCAESPILYPTHSQVLIAASHPALFADACIINAPSYQIALDYSFVWLFWGGEKQFESLFQSVPSLIAVPRFGIVSTNNFLQESKLASSIQGIPPKVGEGTGPESCEANSGRYFRCWDFSFIEQKKTLHTYKTDTSSREL